MSSVRNPLAASPGAWRSASRRPRHRACTAWAFLAFLAVQSQRKAFGDQAFAEMLDRVHAAVEGLGNLDIRPPGPLGICLEQALRATKLLRRSLEMFDDPLTDHPLFLRQPNHGLLVHGKPPCDQQFPNNSQNQQPHFLDLKTH